MKRQVQEVGIRPWYGDDWLSMQQELLEAQEALYAPYGSCVVSGCGVSGSAIAKGIVYLDGKMMRFAGATGVSFPCYLKANTRYENREYQTGGSKKIAEIHEAVVSSSIPSGDYITFSAQGGKTFRQAFQDANNRMVSDAKINEWNASRGNAVSDVRGGVGSAHNTLQKIYAWAVGLFDTKVDKSVMSSNISSTSTTNVATSKAVKDAKENAIATASGDATTKSNNARNNAVNDVRGGVATAQDTLKKLYDWAVGLFNTKIDKTVMSSNISSTSTTNVATSKAVNDAKQNAIATASSDATTKANAARSNAVSDVRGGIESAYDTLKKLFDWNVENLTPKFIKFHYAMPYTDTSYANHWVKIGSWVATGRFRDFTGIIEYVSRGSGTGHSTTGIAVVRCKQQNELGNPPDLFISNLKLGSTGYKSEFVLVTETNTQAKTEVGLYFRARIPYNSTSFNVKCGVEGMTFLSGQPFLSSLPAGAQTHEANIVYDVFNFNPDSKANTNGNSSEDFSAKTVSVDDLIIR